jgi:hypothetical protein
MLMAAGPEQHGVTSNDWDLDRFEISPVAIGTGRAFPTIVGELRRARPSAAIGVFHDRDGFGRLVERDAATVVVDLDGPQNTVERAVAWWDTGRPALTLIHLDHVDHAGHENGWLSVEYLEAVREADRLLQHVVIALRERRLWDRTAIIVTADHGGVGKKHGGLTQSEIEIPWIAAGAGIVKGRELKQPVTTIDTAATIAFLLGVPPHSAWTGRPVREAFRTSMSQRYDDAVIGVLGEFARAANAAGFPCEILEAGAAVAKCPHVRRGGLVGALWSPNETWSPDLSRGSSR